MSLALNVLALFYPLIYSATLHTPTTRTYCYDICLYSATAVFGIASRSDYINRSFNVQSILKAIYVFSHI